MRTVCAGEGPGFLLMNNKLAVQVACYTFALLPVPALHFCVVSRPLESAMCCRPQLLHTHTHICECVHALTVHCLLYPSTDLATCSNLLRIPPCLGRWSHKHQLQACACCSWALAWGLHLRPSFGLASLLGWAPHSMEYGSGCKLLLPL